ncbi:hypothetical protein [Roseicyclus persicicus]|uniref:Uncharacterized protein n=1 Tax=Roseicyclus persicicus TaxID=2650661 RepID=A0A7X6JXE4_9RHOB|nr:hypothetical protein [Roseibacterium persicicum]NKX44715.1 hypothetical protein [Roseibacterium persicicum]
MDIIHDTSRQLAATAALMEPHMLVPLAALLAAAGLGAWLRRRRKGDRA